MRHVENRVSFWERVLVWWVSKAAALRVARSDTSWRCCSELVEDGKGMLLLCLMVLRGGDDDDDDSDGLLSCLLLQLSFALE